MRFFKPDAIFDSVTDITPAFLKKSGITALLLDVDGTLALRGSQQPLAGVPEWIEALREAGIAVSIVSNANPGRVKPFAKKVGLPCRFFSLKPLPWGMIKAKRSLGQCAARTAMAGDQFVNDILGANLWGMKSLYVAPPAANKPIFPFLKKLDRYLLKRYRRALTHRKDEKFDG